MPKQLTLEMIEVSLEIQTWLDQFGPHGRSTAVALLLQLRFVSRDVYAEWLKTTLGQIPCEVCSLYAVRKFEDSIACIWDQEGLAVTRPATSMGSEDLVQSVIASMVKADPKRYLDHASAATFKATRDFQAVLIDDSIGSGDRVASFVKRMFADKSYLSRWSFGWIGLHVVAYARTVDSERKIIENLPGTEHGLRVHPKTSKIHFYGRWTFDTFDLHSRWGTGAREIQDLCDSVSTIPKHRRRGYGATMSNMVFYHSVPNNIPGILWFQNKNWNALFPRRSVPEWLPRLLEGQSCNTSYNAIANLPNSLQLLLSLIKQGRRTEIALSRATGYDITVLRDLLDRARGAGLINTNNRLTEVGRQKILENKATLESNGFDRSLYIPKKWCAGRGTVQPSGLIEETRRDQTESASDVSQADGDAGQASLERTDAKTTTSSLYVTSQNRRPLRARKGGNAHGPLG